MATKQEEAKESLEYLAGIKTFYTLDADQYYRLIRSPQLENIIAAAKIRRVDQVTIMLIQDNIIEKWPS